jgi:hypothetical protein
VPYDPDTDTRGEWPFEIDQRWAIIAHLDVLTALNEGEAVCRLILLDLEAGRAAGDLCVAAREWQKRTDVFSLPGAAPSVSVPVLDDAGGPSSAALSSTAAPAAAVTPATDLPPVAGEDPDGVDPVGEPAGEVEASAQPPSPAAGPTPTDFLVASNETAEGRAVRVAELRRRRDLLNGTDRAAFERLKAERGIAGTDLDAVMALIDEIEVFAQAATPLAPARRGIPANHAPQPTRLAALDKGEAVTRACFDEIAATVAKYVDAEGQAWIAARREEAHREGLHIGTVRGAEHGDERSYWLLSTLYWACKRVPEADRDDVVRGYAVHVLGYEDIDTGLHLGHLLGLCDATHARQLAELLIDHPPVGEGSTTATQRVA